VHLVAPDILAETQGKGLSLAACITGMVVGLTLWGFAARAQRFWLVLLTTVSAGLYGLSLAETYDVQPLVAGLLMAVAAGVLSVALARLFAFLAGGVAACLLLSALFPTWREPFVFFFAGGFLALSLMRVWLMALASLAGSLLMLYCTLWLLEHLGQIDAAAWAAQRHLLLDWACGGLAVVGFAIQFLLDRRRQRKERRPRDSDKSSKGEPRAWRLWWWGSGDSKRKRAA